MNLKLINGTSGNYYNGYNGDSFRTGIPSGFDIYEYDQFPLEKPVNFNITINSEIYLLPFFKTTNYLNQILPYLGVMGSLGILVLVTIIYFKKKKIS